jgi:hypothetical protein
LALTTSHPEGPVIHAESPDGLAPLSGSASGVDALCDTLAGGPGALSRRYGYWTGPRRMIPRTRIASGAVVALCLAGLVAGCSGNNPGGGLDATTPATAAPSATVTGSSSPPSPAQSSALAGSVLFFHNTLQADGGIYALRNGQITPWHLDSSLGLQSLVVSPQGNRIAYIASGHGDEGPLRVINANGTSTDVGPQTLENIYLPVWAPDGGSVLAVYNATPDEQHPRQDSWVRINVTSGAVTPVATPNGWFAAAISPDLNYAYMFNMAGSTTSVVAHLDGTAQTPIVTPAGTRLSYVLSVSPDGHHIIGQVQDRGAPYGGDAGRKFDGTIVDIRTGTTESPPIGDGVMSGYYRADGSAVLLVDTGGDGRTQAVLLVSSTGTVLGQEPVPATIAGDYTYTLLGYVPAG